jgi:choline dehydrogenase-like flavoprotein
MAGIITDESRHDTSRGFAGGYEMETIAVGLPFLAAFLDPGAWGRDFADSMDRFTHMAGLWIVGEDMPQADTRITLHDSEKDAHGLPIPNVHFDDHPNDIAMREHGFQQGTALYESVGANKVIRTPPYPSTHNLGTCRMSEREDDGVCNAFGQAHEIPNLFISDGSQFTTGAAENPTLTIVTLAIRQADYMSVQMNQKAF